VADLGIYSFAFELDEGPERSNDPGFGSLAGVSYEFTPHFQLGRYFSWGQTSEPGIDYDHVHVAVPVNAVAF
jgi:hypothetical protein